MTDPGCLEIGFRTISQHVLTPALGPDIKEIVNVDNKVCLKLGVPVARLPLWHFGEASADELFFTMSFPVASTIRMPVKRTL